MTVFLGRDRPSATDPSAPDREHSWLVESRAKGAVKTDLTKAAAATAGSWSVDDW